MTRRGNILLRNLLALAPALVLTVTAVGLEGRNNSRVTADYLSKQAQLASTILGNHFERLLALATFCAEGPSITVDWDPKRFVTSCGRAAKMLDAWVVVVELGPTHRQLINTGDGAPKILPAYPRDTEYPTLIELEERSRISGKPGISAAILGKVFKGPKVTAGQWVRLYDGRPAMVYAGLTSESLSDLLRQYGSPTNTVFELYDGSRRIVARSEDSDRFVLVSAAPWAQQAMDIAAPGVQFNVAGPAEIGGTWNVGYSPVETAAGWMVVALEPADQSHFSWSFLSGYGGLVAFGLFLSGAMFWFNANRSRLEAEIGYSELARSISESTSRDKSEFLASFAHDVRTPLVSLIGSLSLLETGKSDRSEVIANIDRSAQGLLHLVDDILELSFLGSGRFELQMSPVDLRRLTLDTQTQMQLMAVSKNLAFNINIDDSVPLSVEIDRMRIQQVLTNLVSNAIKYTEKGSVSLAVSATPRAGGKTALRFSVADTGVGIRPEELSELGREFGRLDSAIEGKEHGTGLGLAICKRILKAMGTELEIESEYGRGSIFSFSLIARVLPDASLGDEPRPLAGIRILYVEDEPVIRRVTTQQLTSAGAEVVSVADGQNALDEISKQEPQLLLIDLQMPRMDGVQTIRALKAMRPDHRFPIFILTSHIAGPQTAKAREAGADVILTKPIQIMPLAAAYRARGNDPKGVAPNISPTLPMPADGLIDLDNLLVHLRADPTAMLEVHIPDFESRMRKDLAQLSADIRAGRHVEAEKLAHRCLGLCLVYGAAGLATQLKSLERAAAAGNFGTLSSQNEDWLDLLERTTAAMRELGREWIKTA